MRGELLERHAREGHEGNPHTTPSSRERPLSVLGAQSTMSILGERLCGKL